MAATLLSGALSFHVGVQRQSSRQECQGDLAMARTLASGTVSGSYRASSLSSSSPCVAEIALSAQLRTGLSAMLGGGKTSFRGLIASPQLYSCLPLFLSTDNVFRQHIRGDLLQRSRNRGRSIRVDSLKDSQREIVHETDEQSKQIELGLPLSANENGNSESKEAHSSESPEEVIDFLAAKADEEDVSLKEEVKAEEDEEGMSGTIKGTIIATVLLLAFVGAFGVLGVVYKEQINDILTQFSDFLEGRFNSLTPTPRFIFCSVYLAKV